MKKLSLILFSLFSGVLLFSFTPNAHATHTDTYGCSPIGSAPSNATACSGANSFSQAVTTVCADSVAASHGGICPLTNINTTYCEATRHVVSSCSGVLGSGEYVCSSGFSLIGGHCVTLTHYDHYGCTPTGSVPPNSTACPTANSVSDSYSLSCTGIEAYNNGGECPVINTNFTWCEATRHPVNSCSNILGSGEYLCNAGYVAHAGICMPATHSDTYIGTVPVGTTPTDASPCPNALNNSDNIIINCSGPVAYDNGGLCPIGTHPVNTATMTVLPNTLHPVNDGTCTGVNGSGEYSCDYVFPNERIIIDGVCELEFCNLDPLLNGGIPGARLTNGASITAYAPIATNCYSCPACTTCSSELRTCSKGTLNGTYPNAPVCVPTPAQDGLCGIADGTPSEEPPTAGLCNVGLPTAVTGYNLYKWDCIGVCLGGSNSCEAIRDLFNVRWEESK